MSARRHTAKCFQDFAGFHLIYHFQRLCLLYRRHAKRDILENLREDAPETEHHARAELHIPYEARDQFPASLDHLLNQHGAPGRFDLIHDLLECSRRFPLITDIRIDQVPLRLVAYVRAAGLDDHRKPDLCEGFPEPLLIMYLLFPRDRNGVSPQNLLRLALGKYCSTLP